MTFAFSAFSDEKTKNYCKVTVKTKCHNERVIFVLLKKQSSGDSNVNVSPAVPRKIIKKGDFQFLLCHQRSPNIYNQSN